jgi:hypothetical protein
MFRSIRVIIRCKKTTKLTNHICLSSKQYQTEHTILKILKFLVRLHHSESEDREMRTWKHCCTAESLHNFFYILIILIIYY